MADNRADMLLARPPECMQTADRLLFSEREKGWPVFVWVLAALSLVMA